MRLLGIEPQSCLGCLAQSSNGTDCAIAGPRQVGSGLKFKGTLYKYITTRLRLFQIQYRTIFYEIFLIRWTQAGKPRKTTSVAIKLDFQHAE